ncbi:hypothetical protein HDR68_01910 [bacterium]|nr:hypothetical protein [bacterium]
MRNYLFTVIGGVLLSIGRMDETLLLMQVCLALSWAGFFVALQSVQEKNKKLAGICAAFSLLLSGFWFPNADSSRQILWIISWIAGLLIVWPLRFIALGEIASALLGCLFFWHTGVTAPLSATAILPLPFYIVSALLLFAASFYDNRMLYSTQKAVQHYSLPVLLGSLIPTLDRAWQKPAHPLPQRLLPLLYWLTVAGFLYF